MRPKWYVISLHLAQELLMHTPMRAECKLRKAACSIPQAICRAMSAAKTGGRYHYMLTRRVHRVQIPKLPHCVDFDVKVQERTENVYDKGIRLAEAMGDR